MMTPSSPVPPPGPAARVALFMRWVMLRLLHPATWVVGALLLAAIFCTLHVLGWREDTSIISGTFHTPPPTRAAAERMILQGAFYAASWFATILLSPILLLGAALQWLLSRIVPPRSRVSRRDAG